MPRYARWPPIFPLRPVNVPAVAVRDIALQPRTGDVILGTHGRGIWIIDDITPLRALTPELLAKEAAFIEARPAAQQMPAGGGWANGDAVFVGDNPTDEAVITSINRSVTSLVI